LGWRDEPVGYGYDVGISEISSISSILLSAPGYFFAGHFVAGYFVACHLIAGHFLAGRFVALISSWIIS
jgi:hypothetical protein